MSELKSISKSCFPEGGGKNKQNFICKGRTIGNIRNVCFFDHSMYKKAF